MINKDKISVENNQIFSCQLLKEKINIPLVYTKHDYADEYLLVEEPEYNGSEYVLIFEFEYYQKNRKEFKIHSFQINDRERKHVSAMTENDIADVIHAEICNWFTETVSVCENALKDLCDVYDYICKELMLVG